jgi:hypothetical protein
MYLKNACQQMTEKAHAKSDAKMCLKDPLGETPNHSGHVRLFAQKTGNDQTYSKLVLKRSEQYLANVK